MRRESHKAMTVTKGASFDEISTPCKNLAKRINNNNNNNVQEIGVLSSFIAFL